MKSRQLNKMYQMMRVSRFYNKHKALITVPAAKKIIKTYNDKMDSLLLYALEQREDIKYGAKEKNRKREEFIQALLMTCKLAAWCLLEAENYIDRGNVNYSYTGLKSLNHANFETRSEIIIKIINKHAKELKDYGVKEKDILWLHELSKQYKYAICLPGALKRKRKINTCYIREHLEELNKMQREKLDMIAGSLFESKTIKSEYRDVRKYVKHKHPQGMFDEMLTWYGGVKRLKKNKKKVLKNIMKEGVDIPQDTTVMEHVIIS